eukprot:3384579-Pyramimonas_sp.AAC.2
MYDELLRHSAAGRSERSPRVNCATEEGARCDDKEEHTRDRNQRRLRGSLAERRSWWAPGLSRPPAVASILDGMPSEWSWPPPSAASSAWTRAAGAAAMRDASALGGPSSKLACPSCAWRG